MLDCMAGGAGVWAGGRGRFLATSARVLRGFRWGRCCSVTVRCGRGCQRGRIGGGWQPPDGVPHFEPRAKSVIWLFMNGGVSHMESFDPKPMLTKYAGRTIAETPFADSQNPDKLKLARVTVVNDANGQQRNRLYPLQVGFRRYGQSGMELSDWVPEMGACADDLAVVRSMFTTDDNHGAQTQFHSGRHMLDGEFPTLGAWVHYGLGSLNDNLPQFISIGGREYWNAKDGHYLGPEHDAVPVRIDPSNPLDYGQRPAGVSEREQRLGFRLTERWNRLRGEQYPGMRPWRLGCGRTSWLIGCRCRYRRCCS